MYAINLADWTGVQRHHPEHAALLAVLQQHIDADPGHIIDCERGKIAGCGVMLICPDGQAEAIVKLIRMRLKRWQLRIYYSATGKGGWKRV